LHLDLFEQPAGIRLLGRLLKKAHLRRWRARALPAAYPAYASVGASRAALHLDLFEQPAGMRVLQ
jgi:hypothetical protein